MVDQRRHYARTCEQWLARLDLQEHAVRVMAATVGPSRLDLVVQRWRMFFMACAELFQYDNGDAVGRRALPVSVLTNDRDASL